MRSREHGGAGLFLLFALVASVAAGIAAYWLIKNRPVEATAQTAPPAAQPEPVRAVPVSAPAQVPQPEPEPMEPVPAVPTAPTRDRNEIASEVRKQKRRIARCVEISEGASGFMKVRFTINADGTVHDVRHESPDIDAELASCVVDVFKKLRFSDVPGADQLHVSFPVRLDE